MVMLGLLVIWAAATPTRASAITTATGSALTEGDGCFECGFESGVAGTHGRMILKADGHGGVSVFLGSNDCPGCAWRVVLKCPWGDPLLPCMTEKPYDNPCTTSDGKPGQRYVSSFAPHGTDWQPVNPDLCIPDETKLVSLDDVLAGVKVYVDQLVPPAGALQHQPAGYALVRLPLLMRTDVQQVPAKNFFVNADAPVGVLVKVTPFAWHWRVNGAEVLSTDFPGRAYEQGRSPRQEPGYYASHTFGEIGSHQLSVTIDWSAAATIAGVGTFDVDGFTPRTSPNVPIQVKQARSQLES